MEKDLGKRTEDERLRGLLDLGGGPNGHGASPGDDLDGAVLDELAGEAARKRAANLVLLNKGVQGDVLGLLGSRRESGIEELLGEDDTVVLLLAELGSLWGWERRKEAKDGKERA
jgi:hypothetical protein